MGFAVLSLVTEVNSVFNKTRIIHVVAGIDRASEEFQLNARINLATFAIQMAIVAWMNHQSFLYLHPPPCLPPPLQPWPPLRQLLEHFGLPPACRRRPGEEGK